LPAVKSWLIQGIYPGETCDDVDCQNRNLTPKQSVPPSKAVLQLDAGGKQYKENYRNH